MRPRLLVQVSGSCVSARLERRGKVVWAAEAAHAGPDDLMTVIGELVDEPEVRRARPRADVCLLPPLVQVRRLDGVPRVGAGALAVLIANQSGRFFRRNGKPLVSGAVWAEAGRRGRRTVIAAAIEAPWLDAIASGVRASQLELGSIRADGAPARLELLPAMETARRRRRERSQVRGLLLAALGAWVLAGTFAVGRLVRERGRVEREIASLTAPADAAIEAGRAIERARRTVEVIREAEGSRGAAIQHLGSLAAALPADAWLTSIQWDSTGAGLLTGSARRAASVIARLEKSGIVSPEMVGSAVRESSSDGAWERFTVRFGAPPQ